MLPAPVVLPQLLLLACGAAGLQLELGNQVPTEECGSRYTWEASNVTPAQDLARRPHHAPRPPGGAAEEAWPSAVAAGTAPAKAPEVVFIAGLEGAGHHFIMDLIVRNMRRDRKMTQLYFPDTSWKCGEEWKPEGKNELTNSLRQAGLKKGQVYVFPECRSFPECGIMGGVRHDGRQKRYHPRLDWIQEAVKAAGAELSVLLIYRPLEDCLAANCLHRAIEQCDGESEVLRHNALQLSTYISALPKSKVSCFEYGKMDSMLRAFNKTFGDDLITPQDVKESFAVRNLANMDGRRNMGGEWLRYMAKMDEGDRAMKGTCTSVRGPR